MSEAIPELVPVAEISRVTGVDAGNLGRLLSSANVAPAGRGKWPAAQAIRAVVAYYRDRKTEEDLSYEQERTGHEKAKRELAELELAKRREELVPVDEARKAIDEAFRIVATQLDQMPELIAVPVSGAKDIVAIKEILRKEIRKLKADAASKVKDYLASESA